MKPRINLPSIQLGKRRTDPITDPTGDLAGTVPLNRRQTAKLATTAKEITDESNAVNLKRTKFTDDKDRSPAELLFAAVLAHVLQRINKEAPSQVFVGDELLLKLIEEAKFLSPEGFTGKYHFSNPWDSSASVIAIGRDYMLGETLAINQVICSHKGDSDPPIR